MSRPLLPLLLLLLFKLPLLLLILLFMLLAAAEAAALFSTSDCIKKKLLSSFTSGSFVAPIWPFCKRYSEMMSSASLAAAALTRFTSGRRLKLESEDSLGVRIMLGIFIGSF